MKLLFSIFFTTLFAGSFAVAAFAPSKSTTYSIDPSKSTVNWRGEKYINIDGSKMHTGTVAVEASELQVTDFKIVGGQIVIDLGNITVTDIKDEGSREKLVKHLKSPDFFNVAQSPKATFTISKVEFIKESLYKVTGLMKIRGVEKQMSFNANITKNNQMFRTTGKMTVNRRDFGVSYNSQQDWFNKTISIAEDKVIKDEFELDFTLVARAGAKLLPKKSK